MFKLLFVAAAAAMAPPKISLDLSGVVATKEDYAGHTDVAGVTRQDYVERCPAGAKNNENKACAFPTAKAFDSFDKEVPVTKTIWLVDQEGTTLNKKVASVSFAKRATYLFKYDALDKAGNKAEQVVFVLLVDDRTKPAFNTCQGSNLGVIEAASKWTLCQDRAWDNMDKDVTSKVRYTITMVGSNKVVYKNAKFSSIAIDTNIVGKYLVKGTVSDNAGIYGKGGSNNRNSIEKAFEISDTTKPVITIMGDEPAQSECTKKYKDTGAVVKDTLDTVALKKTISPAVKSTVRNNKVGRYTVTYNAADNAGNKAATKIRRVDIKDTTKPTITLKGGSKQVHYSEDKFVENGVTTSDTCDKTTLAVARKWITPFTDKKIGSYKRSYTVRDASGNTASVTREYVVVDNKKPIITITGADSLTFEASTTAKYTDAGAKCSDYVDGDLTNAIISAGKPDLATPGSYTVTYACADLSKNTAVMMTRTVVVKDTTCPVVTLKGKKNIELEAGFAYKDAGASASDSVDGKLKVTTDGDTVNSKNAFFARRNCKEIATKCAACTTGEYYITTYVNIKKTFDRVKVWCDMETQHTYAAVVGGKRVIPYNGKQGDCWKLGMKMARKNQLTPNAKAHFAADYFPKKGETSNDYLCTDSAAGVVTDKALAKSSLKTQHYEIAHSEPGKYIIEYHTKDAAGNKECKAVKRTVVVRDTLPPVIKLRLNKELIHTSQSGQKGINGATNKF